MTNYDTYTARRQVIMHKWNRPMRNTKINLGRERSTNVFSLLSVTIKSLMMRYQNQGPEADAIQLSLGMEFA